MRILDTNDGCIESMLHAARMLNRSTAQAKRALTGIKPIPGLAHYESAYGAEYRLSFAVKVF